MIQVYTGEQLSHRPNKQRKTHQSKLTYWTKGKKR
ncbi:hypothetical protein [Dipodfec virus UA23Rod_1071]|uniref:Uncharacterized protein n=1 Tax=Dipodfec virus UA23Rod_1071 TaxID=2929326 RepID=A0A976R770_9VIRU|nr:hypothetical protein [Dipodfec virus UA23Rod_1071]